MRPNEICFILRVRKKREVRIEKKLRSIAPTFQKQLFQVTRLAFLSFHFRGQFQQLTGAMCKCFVAQSWAQKILQKMLVYFINRIKTNCTSAKNQKLHLTSMLYTLSCMSVRSAEIYRYCNNGIYRYCNNGSLVESCLCC